MADINEALRYLGAAAAGDDLRERMQQAMAEAEQYAPRFTWRASRVEHRPDGEWLADVALLLSGRTATKMLAECDTASVLVCTLGTAFDDHVRRMQARDMARAVMLDACGSALVEEGCDRAQEEILRRFPGKYLTDRFSPGYGDLPLSLQPQIIAATDSTRRLGVHVTPSCLMSPQKSVTAVIGLADSPQRARIRGCAFCALRSTCTLRKGGHSCDD